MKRTRAQLALATGGGPSVLNAVGRSYYIYCIETALTAVEQARALVKDDAVDTNHELPLIEAKLHEALVAS